MQADLWKKVEALYQAALAQPPEERAAFLLQACPDDPQLRGEVQSLLDQQADFFLESAPLSAIKALSAGAKLGQLRDCGTARPRWHGRGLARARRAVEARRCHQGAARRPNALPGPHRPFRARGTRGRHPHPSEYLRDTRGRRARRPAVHRHGVSGRAYPEAPHRGPSFENGHAARLGHPDCRRPGGGPPDGNRASRHQADEHLHHHAGAGQDSGLWPSKGRRATSQGSQSGEPHQSDDRGTPDDPGVAVGTVPYMSPEQARGEELDARSDLFSFGAVLYEMATGKAAFTGATTAIIHEAILGRAPSPASAVNPRIPRELDGIIGKALEKDRDLRYQHAADMRVDLKRVKREVDSSAVPVHRK